MTLFWKLLFGSTSLFLTFALWEFLMPQRRYAADRRPRWIANIGLRLLNGAMLLCAGTAPAMTLGALALWAETRHLGLLHLTRWSYPVKFVLSFALLDLAVWAQHWAFHAAPPLWRLHAVHHTDVDVDVSTGLRFHPGEIALSFAYKALVVVLLGAHFLPVALFETVLAAASIFTHANVKIPPGLEPWLRRLIVTPDMHRIHHSQSLAERDSNFGFFLSCWDRLVGTYERDSARGGIMMPLGLPDHQEPAKQSFWWLLKFPFVQ